jgi:hypothetical protein
MRVQTKIEAELEANKLAKERAKNKHIQSLCQFFSQNKHWTSGHADNAYAFTVRYYGEPDAYQTEKQFQDLYANLCQQWIHKSKYHTSKRRYLMPMMLVWNERDSNEIWHHHGVIFLHNDLRAKGKSLLGQNRLKMFSDRVQSSEVTSLYDDENWVRYAISDNLMNDRNHRIQFGPRDTDWRTLQSQQNTNERTKEMKRLKRAQIWCIFLSLWFGNASTRL